MVKKSTIIFCSILFSVDVALILYSLLAHRDMFRYMQLNSPVWLHIAMLLILNVLAVSIFFAIKRRLWVLSGILTPISVFLTICALCISVFAGVVGCLKSEIDDYDKYSGADGNLNERFEFAGLRFDDITDMNIEKVENFYYRYTVGLDLEFEFRGKFYFSKNDYESLRARYSSTEGIEEITYSTEEQDLCGFTGCYDIDESEWVYGLTTASRWDEFEIKFNDEENAFYFVFDGWIG